MPSLRMFHLAFILLATLGADIFAVWAVSRYMQTHDGEMLSLAVISIVGGLGLVAYLIWLIRSSNRVQAH